MSKQEEAGLIYKRCKECKEGNKHTGQCQDRCICGGGLLTPYGAKLYELRREETMRKARDSYFREFNPQSISDFNKSIFGEQSGHLRMVVRYWDMAAALVNDGAIGVELFNNCNGEHI